MEVSPMFLRQWLGRYAGITQEQAQAWIELYMACRATGSYHSLTTQWASDRIRARGGRGPPAGKGGSGATLTTTTPTSNPVRLATQLSEAPIPGSQTTLDDSNTVVAGGPRPIAGPKELVTNTGVTMPTPTPVRLTA